MEAIKVYLTAHAHKIESAMRQDEDIDIVAEMCCEWNQAYKFAEHLCELKAGVILKGEVMAALGAGRMS